MTLTSLVKFYGAVLIGRVNGSRSGALGSWMKEALNSSRLRSTLTTQELLGAPDCMQSDAFLERRPSMAEV